MRVLVDEDFFDRRCVWLVLCDQRVQLIGKVRQPLRELGARLGGELPVRNVAEAIAFSLDQAPARRSEARIETEDPH